MSGLSKKGQTWRKREYLTGNNAYNSKFCWLEQFRILIKLRKMDEIGVLYPNGAKQKNQFYIL